MIDFKAIIIICFAIAVIDYHLSEYYETNTLLDRLLQCPYCLSFWACLAAYLITNATQIYTIEDCLIQAIAGFFMQTIIHKYLFPFL